MARETQTQGMSQASDWPEQESQPIQSIVWGRLYGKNIKKMESFDLSQEKFTAGRSETSNVILTLSDLPERVLCRISKVHFNITREGVSEPVYIKDLSRNGTFVNGELVGNNKTRILQDDDVIAIVHQTHKAFVYKDLSPNEAIGMPKPITDVYYISRKLGSGACGLVRLVYDRRTCCQYAMKIVTKNMLASSSNAKANSLNDPARCLNEANIMKNLTHPCVIKMHDIVDQPNAVYMVLEFMQGGDLLNRIIDRGCLPEQTSKLFFYQMSHAVKYLHDMGITHRDLKPDNVLLQTTDEATLLKVSDFGLSKFVQKDSVMRTLCGTPLYVAPEVLLTGGRGAYTKKVDIWSLGVVLFTCLSGTLPFSDAYGTPAIEQIKKGKYRFRHPAWKKVTPTAIKLIKSMLIVRPDHRPSIDQVLENEWLKDALMLRKAKTLMQMKRDGGDVADNEENFLEPPAKRVRR